MEVEAQVPASPNKKIKFDQEPKEEEVIEKNAENSDMSCDEDENDQDAVTDDDCDASDYYDDDDDDDNDGCFYESDNDYLSMQAQFDNVDLPPGVEASFSFIDESKDSVPPSGSAQGGVASSSSVSGNKDGSPVSAASQSGGLASSSSNVIGRASGCGESSSGTKDKEENVEEIMRKYVGFKSFDTVEDCSDHYYYNEGFKGVEPPKAWSKKVQDEWKILAKDLPETIYVRCYESRMDILRAVIVGPQGTPYHDGLFVFDVHYPAQFPDVPPLVYYHAGGLRINPNLYDNGKVCLSLLNTWQGKGCEKWVPKSSTTLQVLVSIQALILNVDPFFNEPGYSEHYRGALGEEKSKAYNEDTFILSLKTMVYTLRRPPKYFEELVTGHFRARGHDILSACKAYIDGASVGSLVHGKVPEGFVDKKRGRSEEFKRVVGRMINGLVSNFTRMGVPDCEKFRQ